MIRPYSFDAKKTKDEIVTWIRNYFRKNGSDCIAVVGMSSGKDSTIVAALCCEALGKDRVFGVIMPNDTMSDSDIAVEICEYLDIDYMDINIGEAYDSLTNELAANDIKLSSNAATNLPARLRMATLFMVAQSVNGRVANTCNFSEDYIGWATLFGDGAGQFSPLGKLTVTEVKQIGYELGLPKKFIEKIPADGLTDKSDEDNFGFTYQFLDRYIRTGDFGNDTATAARIDKMHDANTFKLLPMPMYNPNCNWE